MGKPAKRLRHNPSGPTVGENFQQNLRRILWERGLSQKKFGRTLGVSGVAVCRWIGGESLPDLHRVEFVAAALEIPALELLSDWRRQGALASMTRPVDGGA